MQLDYCDKKLVELPPCPKEHVSRHPGDPQLDLGKHWDKELGRTVPIYLMRGNFSFYKLSVNN